MVNFFFHTFGILYIDSAFSVNFLKLKIIYVHDTQNTEVVLIINKNYAYLMDYLKKIEILEKKNFLSFKLILFFSFLISEILINLFKIECPIRIPLHIF